MPTPTPTTIAELCELPGWAIDHNPEDPDGVPGATWTGHGVAVTIRWDGDYECWEATAGDAIPVTYDHLGPAIRFALDIAACITTAAAHAIAAAAPPAPPTTIAELAALPGWVAGRCLGRLTATSPADLWPRVRADTDGSAWLYPYNETRPGQILYSRDSEAGAVRLALSLYRSFHGEG